MPEMQDAWAWTGKKPDEVALIVGVDAKPVHVFNTQAERAEARRLIDDGEAEIKKYSKRYDAAADDCDRLIGALHGAEGRCKEAQAEVERLKFEFKPKEGDDEDAIALGFARAACDRIAGWHPIDEGRIRDEIRRVVAEGRAEARLKAMPPIADPDLDEEKCPGCGLEDEDDSRGGHWRVFLPEATYAEFGPCKRCGWTDDRAKVGELKKILGEVIQMHTSACAITPSDACSCWVKRVREAIGQKP